MLSLLVLACAPPPPVSTTHDTGETVCTDTVVVTETVTEVEVLDLGATDLDDWRIVTGGNWPDPVLGEDCGANGAPCVDCLHLPSGTYARWYSGDDGVWFGATLGALVFQDWEDLGGLGDDGVYYAIDGLRACMPVYDALTR